MVRFDGQRWAEYVTEFVSPDFRRFGDVVRERILPVFDGINQEADEVRNRRYAELMTSTPASEDWGDAGGIAESAMEAGFERYETLFSMRFATLNLFSAALYHLTEQHLVDLAMRVADNYQRIEVSPRDAVSWFKEEMSLDASALPSWSVINELRLVANVVKHAEGHSAEDLRKLRPDLFDIPQFQFKGFGASHGRVRKPLFGEDVYVTSDDFERYHVGSMAFWAEVAAAMQSLTR